MNRRLLPLAVLCLACAAAEAAAPAKKPGPAKFPHLRLDLKAKTIEFDGTFLVADYPLELLVTLGAMRDYESLITTRCKPSTLHVAMLALGLKPMVRDKKDPGKILRQGDPVEILLRYTHNGKEMTKKPHELMLDVNAKKHLPPLPWVFYGSFWYPTGEDKTKLDYLGDAEGSVLGLLGEMRSVVDVRGDVTLEYGMIEIDAKLAPKQGTKITIVVRPAARKKDTAPAPPAPPKVK